MGKATTPKPSEPGPLIDFSQIVMSVYGKPVKDRDDDQGKPMTLGAICIAALGAPVQADKDESGDKKFRRYMLANKIVAAEEGKEPISLSVGQLNTLKERVAAALPNALHVGAVWLMLDPNSDKENADG